MKQFSFGLDTVLDYKSQVLESKQNEHAKAMAAQSKQEAVVNALKQEYKRQKQELNERRAEGLTVVESMSYESYLRHIDTQIRQANALLAQLEQAQEQKRTEVVEAKRETATVEKLKAKKKIEYDKVVLKKNELFIEEFVSNKLATMRR